MATQDMQMERVAVGSPVVRRVSLILAIAAALTIGATIGRETAPSSKPRAAVRPAAPVALTGWETADAARRAEVYQVVTAPSSELTGWGTADAVRRTHGGIASGDRL